ncbi:hypothetical protein D9615_009677 [Tricholomella constricta]|uniref:Uncharacterized protein n=1 Tax=Tricholomella constricta TaxID=117010 RepID=A0A8H5GUN4_9AGAR|nr:hypothetical protein D9615_009677 [Tricholomella constricta]
MSRTGFDSKRRAPALLTQHNGPIHGGTLQGGRDERGSVSDSEDGNYTSYHEVAKAELDSEDVKYRRHAKTSYERIHDIRSSATTTGFRGESSFAYRRDKQDFEQRMEQYASEKQFYQEQARLLKDTFNSKYPDYVYRRRPNNSRRKRKPEVPGLRPSDSQSPLDARDDMGFEDAGDSPTDGEDISAPDTIMPELHRSRPSHDVHTHGDHPNYHPPPSRASPYAYPSAGQPRSSVHENRLSYEPMGGGARILQENASGQSPHVGQQYTYMAAQSQSRPQSQPVPIYGHSSVGGNTNWNLPSVRPSPWLGPAEPSERISLSLAAPKAHRPSASPTWQRSGHPSGANPAGSPLLQTLSSPFFPSDAPPGCLSSLSHPQSVPSSSYSAGPMQPPLLVGREFDNPDLSLSPSLSNPAHPYHSNAGRDGNLYAERQSGVPRGLPSISNYSLSQPFTPSSGLGGPQGYWTPRD